MYCFACYTLHTYRHMMFTYQLLYDAAVCCYEQVRQQQSMPVHAPLLSTPLLEAYKGFSVRVRTTIDSLQVTIKTNLLAELKHQAPN